MSLLANPKKDIVTRYGNCYTAEEWELKKQLEREETEEDGEKGVRAEQEFRAELTAAGIEAATIERLAAMGPVLILRQIESGEMRFASQERENIVLKALNGWGKKLF